MPKRKPTKKKSLDDELDFELEEIRKTEIEIVPPQKPQKPKAKVKTPKKENIVKRKPILIAVVTSVVITVIVTLGLVFAGYKTYQHIYNLGVQSEIDRQANITEEVIKVVEQLKQ